MGKLVWKVLLPLLGGLCFIMVSGCSTPRTLVILIPDHDGQVGKAVVSTGKGTVPLNAAGQTVVVHNRHSLPKETTASGKDQIDALFGEALAGEPPLPEKFILYFQSGTVQLTGESLMEVPAIVDSIRKRQSYDVSINGHTDRVGSFKANIHLSLQRAMRVKDLLIDAGIRPKYLTTSSHGEGNPLIKTVDGMPELKNRRVEVIVR